MEILIERREVVRTNYMIADCDGRRRDFLRKKIGIFKSVNCTGAFSEERELLEKTWLEQPEVVLIYVGDSKVNAFSALKRIKEITPEVNVVFYSEEPDYALDAYDKGADYFLPLPVDDIKIGKLVLRYLQCS